MRKNMKKADCTPEEWAEYLAYMRNWRERNRARIAAGEIAPSRSAEAKAATKARQREKDLAPKRVEARRRYSKTEKAKAGAKARIATLRQDPEWVKRRAADMRRWRTGFTAEQVDAAMTRQEGKCGVCRTDLSATVWHFDHCHDSGKARGVLCRSCNLAEGHVRKSGMTPRDFGAALQHYIDLYK